MPNLVSALCGLPNLGPASCVAFMSSVSICVMVSREVGLVCTVLIKPGPESMRLKERLLFAVSKYVIATLFYLFTQIYGLKPGLVRACYCEGTERFNGCSCLSRRVV